MHTVYLLHCLTNGKNYVGQTCDLRRRLREHRRGRDSAIGRAVKKYGWPRFEIQAVSSNLTPAEADHVERLLIIVFGSGKRQHGYNVAAGGDSAFRHSDETRRRISATMKERGLAPSASVRAAGHQANKGLRRSPATLEKLRLAKMGAVASPETRAKMAAAQRGRKLSAETRAKISAARKRRNSAPGLPPGPPPGGPM